MLDSAEILDIMNQTFMLSLRIAMPFLLVSMILGIVIAIFQAATSINEQTLTFTLPAMGASVWKIKRRLKPTKIVTSKNQKGVENEE